MTLESLALDRFDRLLQSGELLWTEVTPRPIAAELFDFEFRVAASLRAKPQDKEQKAPPSNSTPKGAFDDDDPDFELAKIGDRHRLILNKFSVVRPQFVLPTITFEPQRDALNAGDFKAVWEVLCGLNDQYVAIFNCGVDAGSSVGHKHLQVIPLPENHERGFLTLLRNQIKEVEAHVSTGKTTQRQISSLKNAPFRHAAYRIPRQTYSTDDNQEDAARHRHAHAAEIFQDWCSLCDYLPIKEGQPHNLLLTKDLIVAVPRVKAWMGEGDAEFSCNAASMAGIVWCKTEAQYNAWMKYGPMKALGKFGIGVEAS